VTLAIVPAGNVGNIAISGECVISKEPGATVVAGDQLWLLTSVPGTVTNVKPSSNAVHIGVLKVEIGGGGGMVTVDLNIYDGDADITSVVSLSPQIVVADGTGPTPTISQTIAADWTVGLTRIYAVDFVNGLDTNVGFADPATSSAGDYATACALAGTRAKKTFAGLAAIFPKVGNARIAVILIAAGTYTDDLATVLTGVVGYPSGFPLVRGTVTNATAGSVAFAGTAADSAMAGGVTATGMNAPGYNPTGAPTTSTIQCLKVDGAAPAFAAEPAVPLGWRLRFDAATTTAALRNICRQVCQLSGTDTLLLQTVLPAVPVAGDVFYLEMPGVVIPALNIVAPASSQTGFQFVGIRSSGIWTFQNVSQRWAFCGANGLSSANGGFSTFIASQSFADPILGSITPGGGFRSESSVTLNTGFSSLAGVVSVTNTQFFNCQQPQWGAGCAARNLILNECRNSQSDTAATPSNLGTAATVGIPHTFGANGGAAVLLDGSDLKLNTMAIIGAGASPCIQVKGKSSLIFAGVVSGTAGNTDVGLDLTAARGSLIILATTPTVTGALGDVRLAGGQIITWAQAIATGITDSAGNRILGTAGTPPLAITQFAGSVVGAAGAVVSYLADTGPAAVNQVVALRRPTSLRLATRLRVTNLVNTSANAVTVTLYKNAVATAMTVSIPAASAAAVKFVDSAHPILFADGDDYDLRMDDAADVAGVVSVSAALEWAT
jgi:hypothetical protein